MTPVVMLPMAALIVAAPPEPAGSGPAAGLVMGAMVVSGLLALVVGAVREHRRGGR